ncbi:MAG: hypothetical protein Q9168_007361 [Polycauliona sp. 1 TL-2023]
MEGKTMLERRISYNDSLGTIKWRGVIEGLKGQWLGVEWDDASRGKHDGTYEGRSQEPTAASFIRPDSKRIDKNRSLLSALREKYGSENMSEGANERSSSIVISGKKVDEVGFDVISRKQSAWSDLAVVSLNALRIDSLFHYSPHSQQDSDKEVHALFSDLKWQELDLSRNLFADWDDITNICKHLRDLRVLKVIGNRFKINLPDPEDANHTFKELAELSLANCALEWDSISTLCTQQRFPNLQSLSLAFNPLNDPPSPFLNLQLPDLTTLDLTSCNLSTLQPLSSLTNLPALSTLNLRSNPLTTLTTSPSLVFPHLKTLDLTSTKLPTLSSLNLVLTTFPILCSLKTSHTPLTTSHPSPRLLTIARLPGLTMLNNTAIPPHERQNADLYYLNTITHLILAAKNDEEQQVVEEHPQWHHLCEEYGEPDSIIQKRNAQSSLSVPAMNNGNKNTPRYPPLSLGANLINFTFYFHTPPLPSTSDQPPPLSTHEQETQHETQQQQKSHTLSLPKQTSIYHLKALLGRLYSLPSLELKLVLETDEWDPVPAAKPEDDDWSCSEDDSFDEGENADNFDPVNGEEKMKKTDGENYETGKENENEKKEKKEKDKNLWLRREIELVDSTRAVAFWIEATEARVRVERRDLGMPPGAI